MTSSITLEWTTQNTRQKLELHPIENGWERHEAHKTNTGWQTTTRERIHQPALTITTNWHSQDPLVAYFPEPEAAVVAHPNGLRYRATRSQHWHPIDEAGLTHLADGHGQPNLTPLSETPFEHDQFDGDHPLTTDDDHILFEALLLSPLTLTLQPNTRGETDG